MQALHNVPNMLEYGYIILEYLHGSSPPKNFRPKQLGGGPEQKIKFGGELNFIGRWGGGLMNPDDVMVVVSKDILLCRLGFRFIYIVYIS